MTIIAGALVSGSLRRALYRDGEGTWILAADGLEPRPAAPNDVAEFHHIALELAYADPGGMPVSFDFLKARLEEEISFVDALDGLLVGMDPDFSATVRRDAIRNAERILTLDLAIAKRVRARFLKPANSQEWDPVGARHLAESIGAVQAAGTYRPLVDGTVDRIVDDLNNLIGTHFGSGVEAQSRRSAFLASGLVAELCDASEDRPKLLGLPFRIHEFPQVRKIDPGGKILTGLVKHLAASSSEGSAPIVAPAGDESLEWGEGRSDPLVTAVLRAAELQSERKRRGYRLLDHDLDAIQREIGWIGDRLRSGEVDRAEAALLRLIENQGPRSKPEHIIKTLTGVADQARQTRQFDFAARLLDVADFLEARDSALMCVRGELLRDLGRSEEALAVFRETMERFPQDVVPPNAYAGTLRELGRPVEALAVFRETMERFPHDEVAPNAYAGTLGELGRPEEALAVLRDTMERFPHDVVALNAYAGTLRELGRSEEALAVFRETMERFPDNEVTPNAYAETLRELGRPEEALAVFRETMERFPHNVVAPNAYAGTLRELGRSEEALAVFRETIERFPHDVVPPAAYAETLRELGRPEEALAVFRETMERFPHNVVAPTAYAGTLRELGRSEEALAVFHETMERFPHNVVAPTAYAGTLRELGRSEEALAVFRETMERFPHNVVAPNAYAETLRELGRPEEALAVFRETMERFPHDVVAPTAYAETLRELGRSEEALAVFRETMERFPHDVVPPTAYAGTLRELGRSEEALAVFRETMERFPHNVVAPTAYAGTLRELGRSEEALAVFHETMERFPHNVVAPTAYAETLRELGRPVEALAVFRETMERFPYDVVPPTAYAGTLRELGRPEEALAVFRETMERFPYDVVPPTAYAETLRELGRSEEALAVFRETMERFPHDEVARTACANLLIAGGQVQEGEALIAEATQRLQLRGDWIAFHILAMGHLRRGSISTALEMLRKGRNESPFADVTPYFGSALAVALIMDRKAKEALAELETAIQRATTKPQEATARLVKAHALGECGQKDATHGELSSIEDRFALSARQRELADMLSAKYLSGRFPVGAQTLGAANDNIYRLELELMTNIIHQRAIALRRAA